MIADGKPAHWPAMVAAPVLPGERAATRALCEVRKLIVEYHKSQHCDWRPHHARTDYIVNVVAGLIADAKAIDALHAASDKRLRKLEEENARLREQLAESKRPFSAQMEMQNRRIIALTAELDALRIKQAGGA